MNSIEDKIKGNCGIVMKTKINDAGPGIFASNMLLNGHHNFRFLCVGLEGDTVSFSELGVYERRDQIVAFA